MGCRHHHKHEKMSDDRYVAAIEISSSKIVAAVGLMHADGRLDVIASEQEKGVEGVRYGIIQNLEETSMRITRVLERLQRKPSIAPRVITGLYVGMSGRSLRGITTEVELNLPDDTEIDDKILERLHALALGTAIDSSLEVVDAIPRIYKVGKSETHSPKGAIGNRIMATYDLIVCRPEMRRNLMRTIDDKLGIGIEGFVVTALSTAQVLLTSEEKRLGCMLVDLGAETTTVSIYKEGSLRYFATLPLGARNITLDITSLNVLEERAEEIKLTSGNAMNLDVASNLNMNGIEMAKVSNLIVARSEEIVANIVEQLNYAGLKDSDLPGGLICIGGGTKLNGMIELLGRQTDLSVRRGVLPGYIHLEDSKAPLSEILQVTSVLYSGGSEGEGDCLELPGANELPVTGQSNPEAIGNDAGGEEEPRARVKQGGIWNSFSKRIAQIFSNPEEDDSDLIE